MTVQNERDAMLTAIRILLERTSGAAVNAICEDYPELRGWLLAHDKEVAAAAESATVIRIREEMNRGGAWQGRSLDELELVIENKGDSLAAHVAREISDAVRPLRIQLQDAHARFHNTCCHAGDPLACSNANCMRYAAALKEWEDIE